MTLNSTTDKTCGPRIPDRIGIWKCWFLRRGENRTTRRKTSRSKDENQQQTQPTFDAESGNRTRATLVGGLHGRQMLNHCAIPAPHIYSLDIFFELNQQSGVQITKIDSVV